jgi:oligoendopeptidase F
MAETASKFGELLLLDYLLQNADKKIKLAILCNLLDKFRLSTYTMLSRFRFETKIYDAVSSGVYLDPDTIAKLLVDSRLKSMSDSIEWNPKSRWGWAIASVLFSTGKRYYNFPYAFGQLLVYALYDRYRREGDSFKPEIINILKAGGSAAPRDILAKAGFDITTKAFWETGLCGKSRRNQCEKTKSVVKSLFKFMDPNNQEQ